MYKNSSILNYFRTFTQPPRPNKRSCSEDNVEEPRAIRRARSTEAKQRFDQEEGCVQDLDGTSSRVASRISSKYPRGPGDKESIANATPAPAVKCETSYLLTTPFPHNSVGPSLDVSDSQGVRLTSSQRDVKNGDVVIRNSDDEFDSDSSLEDLTDLLLPGGQASLVKSSYSDSLLPKSPSNHDSEDGRRRSTRRRIQPDKVAAPLRSTLPLPNKKYKFDLDSLARQRIQEEASIENIARANAMLGSCGQQEASASRNDRSTPTKSTFDATFIDTAMTWYGDEDGIDRLKVAIQRTEALDHGKSWSFFDERAKGPLFEQSDFPIMKNDHFERVFGKTISRQQAFLSGYVGELATKGKLPKEILVWIMDAICLESRDDLRYSYMTTLTDASKHFASILSPERITMLFRKIGATAAAVSIEESVIPNTALSLGIEAVHRPNLSSILGLFQHTASDLSAESRRHLICTLCRLALDHSVAKSCHIISAIEDSFAGLIESIPEQDLDHELQNVTSTVFNSITDAILRLRLLQNILASSHRLILIRRRLALACFFQDVGYSRQQADDALDLKRIARHLEGPHFMISNATNYGELAARIGLLSIAIDCGDPLSTPCNTEEEKVFNQDIDVLSLKIKSMFADIVDTGASHVGRTEAKEVLEAFQYRLSYGIRTKIPPKKCMFGDSTFESAAMMETFMRKGKRSIADSVQRIDSLGSAAAS